MTNLALQQPRQDQRALLSKVPTGAARIQVVAQDGKTRFKRPEDVVPSDYIVIGNDGCPIVMIGSPGRKKKVERVAISPDLEEMIRQKQDSVRADDLVETVGRDPEDVSVLDYVMRGLAEEAASLGFERDEADRKGNPTSQISMRRINALKAIGDSWLKRKEQSAALGVDLDSPAFDRVFTYIMDTFRDALASCNIRDEAIETIFANLSRRIDDDWKREAGRRITQGI